MGLAPSASAVKTLAAEAGIESETLQRFLARNAGVAEGRLTKKGEREMRAAYRKTVLVVDEGSLASTVQARDLLQDRQTLRASTRGAGGRCRNSSTRWTRASPSRSCSGPA